MAGASFWRETAPRGGNVADHVTARRDALRSFVARLKETRHRVPPSVTRQKLTAVQLASTRRPSLGKEDEEWSGPGNAFRIGFKVVELTAASHWLDQVRNRFPNPMLSGGVRFAGGGGGVAGGGVRLGSYTGFLIFPKFACM